MFYSTDSCKQIRELYLDLCSIKYKWIDVNRYILMFLHAFGSALHKYWHPLRLDPLLETGTEIDLIITNVLSEMLIKCLFKCYKSE